MIKWRKMPRGARWFLFGIVVVFGATVALLFWPAGQLESGPLPQPNGYDDFVKAGTSVSPSSHEYRELSEVRLREVVVHNAESLKLLRAGLERECRVPLKFTTEDLRTHFPQLGKHKLLAQALLAESRLAELDGRTNDAARSCLDAIRFGHECGRGGLLIDHLVGLACEGVGRHQLVKIVSFLDAPTCRRAATQLESIGASRESPAEVLHVETAWSRRGGGLRGRIGGMIAYRSFNPAKTHFNRSYLPLLQAEIARQSQLALDLATRAYTLDHGKPPGTPADLVPTYLKNLPSSDQDKPAPAQAR